MARLFGIDMQAVIGSALNGQLLAITLHKASETIAPDGGTVATFTDYPAQGVVSKWSSETAIKRGYPVSTVKVLLLQHGLAVEPKGEDEVTCGGKRWRLKDIQQDAGNATWTAAGVA